MVAVLGYSREEIAAAVREMYTVVATAPHSPLHFPVGRHAARIVGYSDDLLAGVPAEALESFAGVGCPFHAGLVRAGDVVLDIGAGSGVDTFIASRLAGPQGRVIALDMTPAMLAKLRRITDAEGVSNIDVLEGSAEHIPLPDGSVDVVTSNGVLNLVPDKRRAASEIFRVLKPGGRVQIADIVIHRPVTPDCLGDPKLWAECVVGATVDEDYLDMFRDAGFAQVELLRSDDYFRHSPSAETQEVARSFGARAIELRMQRAEAAPRRAAVLARRADPRRLARAVARRGLWGVAALVLALAACYGTLLALALLALLGVTVALDEGVWAVAIVVLAAASALVVAAGLRKHRNPAPSLLAGGGALVVAWVMLVDYHALAEIAGFALLAAGVLWDYRLRRYAGSPLRRRTAAAGQSPAAASDASTSP